MNVAKDVMARGFLGHGECEVGAPDTRAEEGAVAGAFGGAVCDEEVEAVWDELPPCGDVGASVEVEGHVAEARGPWAAPDAQPHDLVECVAEVDGASVCRELVDEVGLMFGDAVVVAGDDEFVLGGVIAQPAEEAPSFCLCATLREVSGVDQDVGWSRCQALMCHVGV